MFGLKAKFMAFKEVITQRMTVNQEYARQVTAEQRSLNSEMSMKIGRLEKEHAHLVKSYEIISILRPKCEFEVVDAKDPSGYEWMLDNYHFKGATSDGSLVFVRNQNKRKR